MKKLLILIAILLLTSCTSDLPMGGDISDADILLQSIDDKIFILESIQNINIKPSGEYISVDKIKEDDFEIETQEYTVWDGRKKPKGYGYRMTITAKDGSTKTIANGTDAERLSHDWRLPPANEIIATTTK